MLDMTDEEMREHLKAVEYLIRLRLTDRAGFVLIVFNDKNLASVVNGPLALIHGAVSAVHSELHTETKKIAACESNLLASTGGINAKH